jgi:hypothetical protein
LNTIKAGEKKLQCMSIINSDEIIDYSKLFTLRQHENDTGFDFERDIQKLMLFSKKVVIFIFLQMI